MLLCVATAELKGGGEQLLAACRRGDEGAWEALVLRYQRLIYAIPRRAGLDEDAAAEIFQDVFTTLLESIENIEQPSRLQAWLVTTAKRKTWRTVGRAKALRPFASEEGEGDDEMYGLADEGLLPDEALTRLEEQHLVRAALGTSEGSIGPTRARCLKKLLDALKKKGFS